MQSDIKPEAEPKSQARPSFADELRALGESLPNKGLFAVLVIAWTALFHFYGNPTLGYVNTRSMFGWLQNAYDASTDDNFGMFVPLIVAGLLWWKREELATVPKRVWWPALTLFVLAVLLHIVGYTVQQTRLSVVGFFVGTYALIGLLWGWQMLRATFFPFFLFAFMVPLVSDLEALTLPLRQIATKITVALSHLGGIGVIQKGTLIESGDGHFSYNVEAACSGLRSLTTMLMLGCIFGFTAFRSNWKRAVLIAAAFPLAICGNVIRLLAIVIAANWKLQQMQAARQPLLVAQETAQAFGKYVHDHWLFSLVPYIPAFIGMMLLARWLREDGKTKSGPREAPAVVFSSRPAWVACIVGLAMTAGAAGFLATQHQRQKLGEPGVRVEAQPIYISESGASTNPPVVLSSNRVYLPPAVLDFQSQQAPVPAITVRSLPRDTVFGHRMYGRTNGLILDLQVVLMGADRSSIHKPQYCLTGSGFNTTSTEPVTIRIPRPHPYDLPVMKLKLRRTLAEPGGAIRTEAGVFVYWFVADGELTAHHRERMWWMARDMLQTGVLQRWAYVICFAPCAPGSEDATFEELKTFIANAVPQFHLTSGPPLTEERAEAR